VEADSSFYPKTITDRDNLPVNIIQLNNDIDLFTPELLNIVNPTTHTILINLTL